MWCFCRPEVFKGKAYLLKSVGYQAIARADLFTLPCDQQVRSTRLPISQITPQSVPSPKTHMHVH